MTSLGLARSSGPQITAHFASLRSNLSVDRLKFSVTMSTQKDSEQLMTQGLTDLLKPIVEECDKRLRAVFASQSDLAKQIDALNAGKIYFTLVLSMRW